jgi:hypothetical protein
MLVLVMAIAMMTTMKSTNVAPVSTAMRWFQGFPPPFPAT